MTASASAPARPALVQRPYATLDDKLRFHLAQLAATAVSSLFLILVVAWALVARSVERFACAWDVNGLLPWASSSSPASPTSSRAVTPPPAGNNAKSASVNARPDTNDPTAAAAAAAATWDHPARYKDEKLVKDVRYYAQTCGFQIINETVTTQDGYHLRLHRVVDPTRAHEKHADGKGGYPVLIMHGLFQSSGSFVTSEERSIAFWLARHGGYQVFLGNNRAVFDMGHERYARSDPRFWDWTPEHLAQYDLPAMVDWIRADTGYDTLAYIGHSQGNMTMFMALSQGFCPGLGPKLSSFTALAPAMYAGPLTQSFPFTLLQRIGPVTWGKLFGWLDYIPLMRISYDWTPALPYALLGYEMFAFLFEWTDANWLPRRKAKMFRFAPQPVSSASIHWWTGAGGFAARGCALPPTPSPWWAPGFPPLSVFSGGMDFLVLTQPVIDRIKRYEPHVPLVRWKRQPEAEHCDHFWAADAVEWCFQDILHDIEHTRPPYPEEKMPQWQSQRQWQAQSLPAHAPRMAATLAGQHDMHAHIHTHAHAPTGTRAHTHNLAWVHDDCSDPSANASAPTAAIDGSRTSSPETASKHSYVDSALLASGPASTPAASAPTAASPASAQPVTTTA